MKGWAAAVWTKGRSAPWAWVAFLALAVQAVYVWETSRTPAFAYPLVDSAAYHYQALSLLRGESGAGPYWQPPLFPWFLTVLYGVFGVSMTVARLANGLWAAAVAVGTWWVGRRVAGPRAALAAGLAAAVYGPLVFFGSQLMPTAMGTALILMATGLVLRAWARPGRWRWLAGGAAAGLAALAIPNALAVGVAAAALAWLRERAGTGGWAGARRAGWRAAGWTLLGLAAAVAPVAARNRLVGGQWVLISTNSGINFYIGNNAQAEMTQALRPGLDWDRLVQTPYRLGARNAVEADRYFWSEGLRFAARNPAPFARGLARKTRLFLAAREIPRNLDLHTFRPQSRVLRALAWSRGWFHFPFSLAGPLGLMGLVVLAWRRREARVAGGLAVVLALSVIAFFPAARYRAPLIPFFLIFGAGGVAWLARRVLEPGWRWWAGVAALAAGALVVNRPVAAPTDGVRFDAELEYAIGAARHTRGGPERAQAAGHYGRATALNPDLADAHFSLGVWLGEEGRRAEAIRAYREALRARPDHDRARVNLALALFKDGALGEAADMLEMATLLSPGNARAWRNRGLVLKAMGRLAEAADCLRRAAELDGR